MRAGLFLPFFPPYLTTVTPIVTGAACMFLPLWAPWLWFLSSFICSESVLQYFLISSRLPTSYSKSVKLWDPTKSRSSSSIASLDFEETTMFKRFMYASALCRAETLPSSSLCLRCLSNRYLNQLNLYGSIFSGSISGSSNASWSSNWSSSLLAYWIYSSSSNAGSLSLLFCGIWCELESIWSLSSCSAWKSSSSLESVDTSRMSWNFFTKRSSKVLSL